MQPAKPLRFGQKEISRQALSPVKGVGLRARVEMEVRSVWFDREFGSKPPRMGYFPFTDN
jgi:hypothetical protein